MRKQNLKPADSTLAHRLRQRIQREGPITFHEWMKAALYDEQQGYYCRDDRPRWGRAGDYRTSPERSILFAATFARHFDKLYQEFGSPGFWSIVEVGAGDGLFAYGVLEALRARFPKVFAATHYVIDEASRTSVASIKERLEPFSDQIEFKSLRDFEPITHGIIFSNELLDAFPIHRVTVREGELCEFYVGEGVDKTFRWIAGPPSTPQLVEFFAGADVQLKEGQSAEVNLEIAGFLGLAAAKLIDGYLITVDYGAEATELYEAAARFEGTLRAFYRHQLIDDVLARPGEQDITTTIDWTSLKRIGKEFGFETVEFAPQDKLLLKSGLLEELELLSRRAASDAGRLRLSLTAREMILPGGMAESFQVVVQRKQIVPPVF